MKNKFIIGFTALILFVILGFYFNEKGPENIACTMEAKICPDGSAVGRTGPKCEFAECPIVQTAAEAKINEVILINGVNITPIEVVSDSRCPEDVQCIWAGTVEVKVSLESEGNKQEVVLNMGDKFLFGSKSITLTEVYPNTNSKKVISPSDYRFKFDVR